jgi:glycosyltransferase involved in cell wall biosynthesis
LVINALSALRGGGQTYLLNILRCVDETNPPVKITVIANTKNVALFVPFQSEGVDVFEAKFASKNIVFRVFWEFFILPFWLASNNSKQYFAPGGIMISLMPRNCKSFTALRNMLPFDKAERQRFPLFSYIRFKLWLLRFVFLLSYRMVDGVIFISNYSRDVVEQYMPTIKNKSVVIYHGLNEDFRRSGENLILAKELGLNAGEYYLYVSILDVYKAQKEVIESWKQLVEKGFTYPLVLVGQNHNKYGKDIVNAIENDKSGLIRYLGPVEYHRLPSLYQNARALIFASSCECCPNILLENLASGRPVFSSAIQPMPEFGGDAAIYFDPYEPTSLADKVVGFEADDTNFAEYGNLALEKSKDFDWQKTTNATISYIIGNT